MNYPTCEIDDDYHQLFPSRFPVVPLYERLGSKVIEEAAEALEAKTNPRLKEMRRLEVAPRKAANANRSQNWNLAPFAYPNTSGTTFLSPSHRVLELVNGIRPAIAVAMLKRETFLHNSDEPPLNVEMRAVKRRIKGSFADMRNYAADGDQKARWKLGAEIYEGDVQGIIFHRPDFAGATSIVIFDASVMERAIQMDHYRFVWDGKKIRSIGNFRTDEQISREDLMAELKGSAAA